jgi:DNA relaxase NicK
LKKFLHANGNWPEKETCVPKYFVQSTTAEIFWARRSFKRARDFAENGGKQTENQAIARISTKAVDRLWKSLWI